MQVISKAIKILKDGGIIIYPTDTAFGIGCRIDNHQTVDRLFNLRKRPPGQAMPILVSTPAMALQYYSAPSEIVRHLMERYWPGALTIVAAVKKKLIYSPICGGANIIGIRMPNHQTMLKIIEGVGVPIIGSSANFHGEPTPYCLEDLNPALIKLVDLVVRGDCSVKQASTVVDCTSRKYKIIRQGEVWLNKFTLSIDTSQIETVKVSLVNDEQKFEKISQSKIMKSQMVLPIIEELLKDHQLKLTDIGEIKVATGPGSFTGLRVGISVANMLGNLLNIPINGQKTCPEPKY